MKREEYLKCPDCHFSMATYLEEVGLYRITYPVKKNTDREVFEFFPILFGCKCGKSKFELNEKPKQPIICRECGKTLAYPTGKNMYGGEKKGVIIELSKMFESIVYCKNHVLTCLNKRPFGCDYSVDLDRFRTCKRIEPK